MGVPGCSNIGFGLDESGIATLIINGSEIVTQGKPVIPFSQTITIEGDAVDIRAEDGIGNVTTAKISLPEKQHQGRICWLPRIGVDTIFNGIHSGK